MTSIRFHGTLFRKGNARMLHITVEVKYIFIKWNERKRDFAALLAINVSNGNHAKTVDTLECQSYGIKYFAKDG